MKIKVMTISIYISLIFFICFLILYFYALVFQPKLYPVSFRVPLGCFSMTVTELWGGNVIFFNQESPYTGGTYSISDESDSSMSMKGWDGFGIYYRLIKDSKRTDSYWTLMIRFWYPIVFFGVWPFALAARKLNSIRQLEHKSELHAPTKARVMPTKNRRRDGFFRLR